MKKTFRFILAAAAAALMVGCSKDTPAPTPTPKPEEGGEEGGEKEELYADYVIRVDIKDYYYGLGYSGVSIDFSQYKTDDGQTIMEVFGYSSVDDFCQNLCDAKDGDKDVKFVLFDGDTKFIDESGSNTNGIGHWVTKQGQKVGWGETSAFFTEGNYTSAGDDGNYSLAAVLGSKPDVVTAEDDGMEYVIIEGFSSSEYDVAVEFHVYVTAEAPVVDYNIKGEETLEFKVPYSGSYAKTELLSEELAAKIEAEIGVGVLDAIVYAVNSDGTVSVLPGVNFWFSKEGNLSSWGEGCGLGLNTEPGYWAFCNFPDETLVGQTVGAALMFTNSNNDGYVVKVSVTFEEQSEVTIEKIGETALNFNVEYSGDYVATKLLTDEQTAEIEEKLGVLLDGEDVLAFGVSADGTVAKEPSRQIWFDKEGNVSKWGEGAGIAITHDLEYWSFCNFPDDTLIGQTVKGAIMFTNADYKGYLVSVTVTFTEPAAAE